MISSALNTQILRRIIKATFLCPLLVFLYLFAASRLIWNGKQKKETMPPPQKKKNIFSRVRLSTFRHNCRRKLSGRKMVLRFLWQRVTFDHSCTQEDLNPRPHAQGCLTITLQCWKRPTLFCCRLFNQSLPPVSLHGRLHREKKVSERGRVVIPAVIRG